MGRYSGKTAVVTGGTSGIGLATAKLLLDEGARVLVTGRTDKTLDAARVELGGIADGAIVVKSDTSSLADIEKLAGKVKETLGEVDLLFVNAGVAKFAPLEAVTEAHYDEVQAINAKGAFFVVQRIAPLLRTGGAVVLNTSVVNEKGFPATSVYSATKAALRSLARTFAAELLPRGIRVNAVSPGPITTPILGKSGLPPEGVTGFETQLRETNPMKRFSHPDEVARAVAFLAFEATFTTGAELPVDGGAAQL